jgi:valyl-tRNA synthetase
VDFYGDDRDHFVRSGARLVEAGPEVTPPRQAIRRAYDGVELFMLVDIAPTAATERLVRDWLNLEKQVEAKTRQLNNPEFVERAPPSVVQAARIKLESLETSQMCIKFGLGQLRTPC